MVVKPGPELVRDVANRLADGNKVLVEEGNFGKDRTGIGGIDDRGELEVEGIGRSVTGG